MDFVPDFRFPPADEDTALWFMFDEGRLLTIVSGDSHRIPATDELPGGGFFPAQGLPLGRLDGRFCMAGTWPRDAPLPEGSALTDLRALFGSLEERLIWVAAVGNQLEFWNRSHQYCGRCGQRTEDKADERAKRCPDCGLVNYPRLSPAVIVAVIRDDQILLARNKRFRAPFFSVLAGFVEPGETLEACVEREIYEEVGIRVGNLRYFGSQPWPFPDSLMVAFTADYRDGEITVDNSEIAEAAWFTRDALPQVPPKISIAGQLIDWFVNVNHEGHEVHEEKLKSKRL
ncbi:MAG: NAD(+) diphosphatase [Pseudomonadota bacterium]